MDLHKKTTVATVHTPELRETRTFGTTTREIVAMAEWFASVGITHVAMEGTGVYWKPVYNVLENYDLELHVYNARQVKNAPGRKTDKEDSRWICKILRFGLVQPSFIPDKEQRERRELVTYRKSLICERTREVNRIQKVLEGANIKLASVASDIMGLSGRQMLQAMVTGVTDPELLADMAVGKLRKKLPELEEALYGNVGEHQRLMLKLMLGHIDELDARIASIDRELEERFRGFEDALERLDEIPGIALNAAQAILAVIGVDMSRFPTDGHLASWAGLAPGNNESAGKRKSGKTTKGNRLLRDTAIQVAHAASRKHDSYLSAQFHRVARKHGPKVAAVAVAHSILCIIYHMLKTGKRYQDLGSDYFDKRNEQSTVNRLTERLEALGYDVTLTKAA